MTRPSNAGIRLLIRRVAATVLCGALAWAGAAASAAAQGLDGDLAPVLATIDEAAVGQRASLERVQQLLADGQTEEAVESLRRVMDADGGRLLPLSDLWEREAGFDRWMSVRAVCHWRIAGWAASHPAALELYRQRVDPVAERWYRQGVEQRDRALLERLVDQLLMSRRGDDALLVLGDWALERGDVAAARGVWQQISPVLRTPLVRSPLLRNPPGRPWWIAMVAAQFDQSPQSWNEAFDAPPDHPSWLAYPDTDLNLADVRARFVLASILEQSWRRATLELAWFRHYHADARGRLAGREGLWSELLEEQLGRGKDWPTLTGGASGASRVETGIDPPGAVTWRWPRERAEPAGSGADRTVERRSLGDVEMSAPAVVNERAILVTGASVVALDLESGRAAFGRGEDAAEVGIPYGEIYYLATPGIERADEAAVIGRLPGWLAVADSRVFTVLGGGTFRRGNRASVERLPAALVGLNMDEQAKVFLKISLADAPWGANWQWGGGPVADEAFVYASLQRTDGVRAELHLAAFDARSGQLRWRQFVSSSEARGRAEASSVWLARHEDALYCHTSAGAIARLSPLDGKIHWLTRYTRELEAEPRRDGAGPRARAVADLSPLLVAGDQLFVAPTDSSRVFSLDANTGQVLWATAAESRREAFGWLGATREQVVACGERLAWFDAATGLARGEFPVAPHAPPAGQANPGPHGAGRGLLAGRDVWWPTRDEILVFRQESRREPAGWSPLGVNRIDLRTRGATGGTLQIVGNVLLIHNRQGLQVLVAP